MRVVSVNLLLLLVLHNVTVSVTVSTFCMFLFVWMCNTIICCDLLVGSVRVQGEMTRIAV